MTFFEIAARLLVCCVLVWCLPLRRAEHGGWTHRSRILALIACGFGILSDLKGLEHGGFALAVIVGGIALGMHAAARATRSRSELTLSVWPIAATSIGFFVGEGTLMLAIAITLLIVLMEGSPVGVHSLVQSLGGTSVLTIKAQSIRGVIGRVESLLERLQLNPSHMSVSHNSDEKELTIVAEFAGSPKGELKRLLGALREVEGVIQFALE